MIDVPVGYKQTDVGIIPEDWEVKTLKELTLKIQDGTHFSPKLGGNDFLYLTSKNIRFGYIDITNIEKIDAEQHQSIYKRCDVKKGDLLLTKDGANTGNAAINPLTEEFSLLSSVAFLRFSATNFDARYFLQQILSHKGQERISEAMSGNAITRLTLEKINKLKVSLPPTLAEQTAIATALSDVDALLNKLDKLIAKKRDIKQATMQQLLTGKKRLAGFGDGKGYKQTEIGEIPEDWEVKQVKDFAAVKGGKRLPAGKTLVDTITPHPYIRVTDMTQGGVNFDEIKYVPEDVFPIIKNYRISVQDIFISVAGTLGIVGKIPLKLDGANLTENANKITNIECDRDFLLFNLISERIQSIIESAKTVGAQPKLALGRIECFLIAMPPTKDEQTAIATLLTDMDTEITQLQQRRHKTHALKQGMMQQLLTGKIRLI